MNYSTFDRFQGAWLGSTIATALGAKSSGSEQEKILGLATTPWLTTRDQIAQGIIETRQINAAEIAQQLVSLVEQTVSKANANGNHSNDLAIAQSVNSRAILSLLPLILFQSPPSILCSELIRQCNSFLANSSEIEQDILLWNYLLTSIISNQISLNNTVLGNPIAQILIGVGVKPSCSREQLEIVNRAWLRGWSLRQLTEELNNRSRFRAGEINTRGLMLLALYSFGSTPDNFMLSVKRAANLNYDWSGVVATLTATLSGAYNGINRLPVNWRKTANCNRVYQQAQTTISVLFKTWLGVDSPSNNRQITYDSQTDAVAIPQIIQPRPTLKIISQKSNIS